MGTLDDSTGALTPFNTSDADNRVMLKSGRKRASSSAQDTPAMPPPTMTTAIPPVLSRFDPVTCGRGLVIHDTHRVHTQGAHTQTAQAHGGATGGRGGSMNAHGTAWAAAEV